MIRHIVSTLSPISVVGGGLMSIFDLNLAKSRSDTFIALDGGADQLMDFGVHPAKIIGDLDSVSPETRQMMPIDSLHGVDEQDNTDLEKALLRVSAPLIFGLGLTGQRRDHELATYHALLRFAALPILVIAEENVILHCPPKLELSIPADGVVSLFPLRATSGESEGLKWPIDGLNFAPGHRIGTSNSAIGGPLSIRMHQTGMLAIFGKDMFSAVADALIQAPRWPVLEPVPA